ncbi:probable G-protein coupled receptor 179 [Cygnus atratus]|uniref:probable G-protein coupled receptor 179 n=1 Tax=Cygnus atratus TaxID=8868 RepID=UPI0021B7940C|nr:probable G-protein coupled receptor 179 [Cygnus atratus]
MLFQSNDIREASVAEDVEWYQALVRSLAEGHPWVRRAVLALDAHPLAAKPRLMLQATAGDGEIRLRDVSAAAPSLGNRSWDDEWFNALRSQRSPQLRKRVLSNDLRSMETPKWQRGDSYVGEPGHVRWSPPFLECRDGKFLPAWAVTLSSAFYGLKPDLSPEFKGVVRVDIELRDVGIDQCASGPGWFTGTHRCDLNSTQCVPQESRGFVLGQYVCRCKPGFYGAGGVAIGTGAGGPVPVDGGPRLACRPCREGCATCVDDTPCLIQEDRALRAAVLSCQAFCMLAVFLSMLISYHFRRSKRIRASGVVLLETILFGSLLLYFPVFILYFKPSIFRCIVLRWVRMLGFATVYGTIALKLYRVLRVFLARTAQRVPYMSSGRVLKMLGLILLLVLWFLAAWTVGMLENVDKNIPLVIRTQTTRGLHFYICGHDCWDYMMVVAEMLFLLWGSSLCYATRAVPSAFHEPRFMGIALHNELMISAAFHVARFVMVPSLHPDWTLLLFFAHTHSTVTMTLALLFIPKFLHASSPLREEIAAEVYEDELDMRRSGSCLNSSIASAWSERSLDPDDIREELKKLYAQLEVLKTRRMAANNPHVPKKRGSRRSLGRSFVRRLAELPEAVASRGSREERLRTPGSRRASAKRLPSAGSASLRVRDGGFRRHAAALHKSRSSESPAWDPRGGSPGPSPTRDTVPGTPAATAAGSEQSDSESLDAAPLVCKSASAHNLSGHEQPPQPRALLLKSLSVVAGARDEALLVASRAARDGRDAERDAELHAKQHPAGGSPTDQGPPEQAGKPQSPAAATATAGAPLPAGSGRADGGPSCDASPPGDGKVQKHVTYAPTKSISVDSSHFSGRVRVAVRRTPPPPPVRYQSLVHHTAAAGDSRETLEPPGRLQSARSIPAEVCPWELIQEEILSRKQKAAEPSASGTPGDTPVAPPGLKPSSQKTFKSLGLAIKALNRSRGKNSLKGKKESEGSLRTRGRDRDGGSRRERPKLAGTPTLSPGGSSQGPTNGSPKPSPQEGDAVPCRHNNNAGSMSESAAWGDSRGKAEGQEDGTAVHTGGGEELAEEPSAAPGSADAGGVPEMPSGAHEVSPSTSRQDTTEHPHQTLGAAGAAQAGPRAGAEPPAVGQGQEAPRHPTEEPPPAPPPPPAEPGTGSPRVPGHSAAAAGPWAEVCPWEALGAPRGALALQEATAAGGGSPRGGSPMKVLGKGGSQPGPCSAREGRGTEGLPARSRSTEVAQAGGGLRTEICPWEGSGGEAGPPHGGPGSIRPGAELGKKPPELPAAAPGTAGSMGGRMAEVCPWESAEGEMANRAEICPWEVGKPQPEKGKVQQDGGRLPRGGRSIRPQSLGLLRAQESGGRQPAARRPWGSASTELPPPRAAPDSSDLPKLTSKSPESVRASVCPWEATGASSDRAEVCPWETSTALSTAEKIKEENEISPAVPLQTAAPGGRSEPPHAADQGSSQRVSVCPWEGAEEPGEGLTAESPALPKTSTQAGKAGSKKADVCPWEAEEEPLAKAEICPWEVSAAPPGKGRWSQDTRGTPPADDKPRSREPEGSKVKLAGEGGRAARRDTQISAKLFGKSLEGSKAEPKKSQSTESPKAEVCPWEAQGLEAGSKAEICPWEAAAPPFDEQKAKQPPRAGPRGEKRITRQAALASPARSLERGGSEAATESLKAEVCPWEAQELGARDKAEICPWEVAVLPSEKGKPRQDKGGLSRGGRNTSTDQGVLKETRDSPPAKAGWDRESVCPWEGLGTGGSSAGGTKSPELPKAAPTKPGSTTAEVCPWESPGLGSPALPAGRALSTEVCPWEAQELGARNKAEICPWEAAAPLPGKGAFSERTGAAPGEVSLWPKHWGASKVVEKGSSEREAVCPWENPGTEEPPQKPETGGEPSKKSDSWESRKSDICPREAAEPKAVQIHAPKACPRGADGAAPAGTGEPKPVSTSPPALRKAGGCSGGQAEHKPLRRVLPGSQPLRAAAGLPWQAHVASSSPSPGATVAEVCPWEAEEAPPAPAPATQEAPTACPWESTDPSLSLCQAGQSPGEGGMRETSPDVCPWDHE